MRSRWTTCFVLAMTGCTVSCTGVDLNSPHVPTEVTVPLAAQEGDGSAQLPYFDDYSWRAFLALVWPAAKDQRGVPDEHLTVASDQKPKVFETYKAVWEVIHGKTGGGLVENPGQPAPWEQYENGEFNACGVNPQFGDMVLASFSGWSDIGQGSFDVLRGALVAENRSYIHYWTAYNEVEFNFIREHGAYLPASLDTNFPVGSLSVKASWMEMDHVSHPERYYTRKAWVRDLDNPVNHCKETVMGLIGLHIVQKTQHHQQWIWSTFEQVDNVPDNPPDPLGSKDNYNLHQNGAEAMAKGNPYSDLTKLPWPPGDPQVVLRIKPIHTSTRATDLNYREELKRVGSVWQYYQLVMTQFAVKPDQSGTSGAVDGAFPGTNRDRTAFANTTIETYEQNKVTDSCMGCHSDSGCENFVCSVKRRRLGSIEMSGKLPQGLPK